MIKTFYKHIFLCIGFELALICFFPSSFSLRAQSDEDSVSLIEELTPDEVKTDSDTEGTQYNNFIKIEDRYVRWSPSLQKNIPDTIIRTLKSEDAFWYADVAAEKKKKSDDKKQDTPLSMPTWFRTLIWIIILGGFGFFLITYLAGSNVGLFRKKNVIISDKENTDGEMPEDIFAINYQREIEKASSTGNYRLAIRLMFLQLLKNMSERNIINYKQDKTNFDYLSELQNSSLYSQFFTVTRNYEYSWYGQFEISGDAYQFIRKDFDQIEKQLS